MISIPNAKSRKVKVLLEKINSQYEPEYVSYEPWNKSEVNECFENVRKRIMADGGSSKIGFAIWQTELITEAEYHCIWQDPAGKLLDISKHNIETDRILFLPDDHYPYHGQTINNIRINNSGHIVVDYLIQVYDAIYFLINFNDRTYKRNIILEKKEAVLFQYFEMMRHELEFFALSGKDINDLCFCGRNLPFYACHQDDLIKALREIIVYKEEKET